MNNMDLVVGLIAVLVLIGIYLIPTIVAVCRKPSRAKWAIIINIFLGWTCIGWLVALVIASAKKSSQTIQKDSKKQIVQDKNHNVTKNNNVKNSKKKSDVSPSEQTSANIKNDNETGIFNKIKKFSKTVKDKTVSTGKTIFYKSIKLGLTFSQKAQCPNCKTINEPVSYVWQDVKNGFNNVEKPAPDFGKKENKYKCIKCNKDFSKKMPTTEALCPSCGSVDCMLESDGKKTYIDENYAKFQKSKVSISVFKTYPWGKRVVDLHQIFHCPKCDLNFWQHHSESSKDCCPYCHYLGAAKKRTYVEDVSTFVKTEAVSSQTVQVRPHTVEHRPIYGLVTYEKGYEITEYYCPQCEKIVYHDGSWYTKRLK